MTKFVAGSAEESWHRTYTDPSTGQTYTGEQAAAANYLFGAGDGRPVGIFFDFCSLPQKPYRTPEEEALFKEVAPHELCQRA